MSAPVQITLTEAQLEQLTAAVAERVLAGLLAHQAQDTPAALVDRENGRTALLSPRDVGMRIGRSPEWVREHRGEFEQVRLSDGEKPRLLFTAASVDAWLEARSSSLAAADDSSAAPRRRRARKRSAVDVELLPIRASKC